MPKKKSSILIQHWCTYCCTISWISWQIAHKYVTKIGLLFPVYIQHLSYMDLMCGNRNTSFPQIYVILLSRTTITIITPPSSLPLRTYFVRAHRATCRQLYLQVADNRPPFNLDISHIFNYCPCTLYSSLKWATSHASTPPFWNNAVKLDSGLNYCHASLIELLLAHLYCMSKRLITPGFKIPLMEDIHYSRFKFRLEILYGDARLAFENWTSAHLTMVLKEQKVS